MKTRRQHIVNLLRERPEIRPTALSDALSDEGVELSPDEVVSEIDQVVHSLDDEVLVAPAECRDCGFSDWDKKVNIPSKCPVCHSEWIEEPIFKIENND